METTHVFSCPLNVVKLSESRELHAFAEGMSVAVLASENPDAQFCKCAGSQENKCCISAGLV